MRLVYLYIPLVLAMSFAISCDQSTSYESIEQFELNLPNGGAYVFKAINEDLIQVKFVNDTIASDQIYAPSSLSSIKLLVSEDKESYELRTPNVRIEIEKSTYAIKYFDHEEKLKLVDQGGLRLANDSSYYNFLLTEDESIYGTGFRALPLNRRGEKLLIYNRPQYGYGWGEKNLNYTIPHWTSSYNYGLLVDNPARAILDIGKGDSNSIIYASKGGNLVYYFLEGQNQKALLKNLTDLTGKQPLPPRWAFGNLQSRFGYRSQKEAETILQKALDVGYPVDAIILDIYWFGPELEDGQMGRLDWDSNQWPYPKKMIRNFEDKGVKTILVTEPFFTRKSKHYSWLSEKKYLALDAQGKTYDIEDFYFGAGGLLDIFKPEASNWMWEQYKYLRSFGVSGLWVDLGEPEKHPHDMIHINGKASQVHGIYGHEWARMLYEGYQRDYPNERLFHMGRSGFVGTQRFGLIPWTGDVGRGWSGLKAQLPAIMSMGMSGLGYMHSDAGGFSMIDTGDPELYTRWLQLSAFTSVFRPHADAVVPPEPVFWDEKTQENVKNIIALRYAMLPYHYTLAYENHQSGLPFVRPMMMEFPEVSDTLYQQFMYGSDMLIAPVISQGESHKSLYLPAGYWYDYFSNERMEGGRTINKQTALNEIPVYVKSGAIIPTSPENKHAGSYTGENLSLTYYISESSSKGTVYFDDGKSSDPLGRNEFELLMTKVSVADEKYRFNLKREGRYSGIPDKRSISFVVIGLDKKPAMLPDEAIWDEQQMKLSFTFDLRDQKGFSFTK